MAEGEKKSFVLYFDMYPSIHVLPDDQKGMLLDAVFEYARSAAAGKSTPEEVLLRFPDMSEACCMAFRFVAEIIRRDTEKWKAKHIRYSKASKARWEKERSQYTGGDFGSEDEMRKYIRQMQEWAGLGYGPMKIERAPSAYSAGGAVS